jgi:colanic acid/amylovoran biosynthesis glycosyltransferase
VLDNKTGFLVPAKDIDAMKKRIGYLIENPERWHEMGRAGRANVESKYDIDILNKKLERIFQGLIDRNST